MFGAKCIRVEEPTTTSGNLLWFVYYSWSPGNLNNLSYFSATLKKALMLIAITMPIMTTEKAIEIEQWEYFTSKLKLFDI